MNQENAHPYFKKVLVIDDTETDRYVANFVMRRNSFAQEIVLKESARKALIYLRSLEGSPQDIPEIIFLDIRMPEMDGFQFLAEYSELPDSVKAKSVIIMLSTSLNPHDHERATSNSFVKRFLDKPLNKQSMEILKRDFMSNI